MSFRGEGAIVVCGIESQSPNRAAIQERCHTPSQRRRKFGAVSFSTSSGGWK